MNLIKIKQNNMSLQNKIQERRRSMSALFCGVNSVKLMVLILSFSRENACYFN
jgi:hypothetical protein